MAWETRRDRRYYYRKRRIGNRVISEYIGTGERADAVAQGDLLGRLRMKIEHDEQQRQQDDEAAQDEVVAALSGVIGTLAAAGLLLDGCYQHHGSWRRRRRA